MFPDLQCFTDSTAQIWKISKLPCLRQIGRSNWYIYIYIPGSSQWPFQGLSDLHLGYQKVTWKKLVYMYICIYTPACIYIYSFNFMCIFDMHMRLFSQGEREKFLIHRCCHPVAGKPRGFLRPLRVLAGILSQKEWNVDDGIDWGVMWLGRHENLGNSYEIQFCARKLQVLDDFFLCPMDPWLFGTWTRSYELVKHWWCLICWQIWSDLLVSEI